MATDLVSKQELLENMRTSGRAFAEAVRAYPADQWGEGRYEEGWSAKDILAHVASVEWTYPKILDLADGKGPPPKPDEAKDGVKSADLPGGYNERHVAKRKDNSIEELLGEFETNRTATIGAVEEADEDLLRVRVRSAGGVEGTAAEVLNYLTVVHLNQHLDDLRGAS